MLIVTSIPPKHANIDNIKNCVDSWLNVSEVYSINPEYEIEKLKELYPDVNFVKAKRTVSLLLGKPLVLITEIIDLAIEKESDLFIINADIEIMSLPELKDDGVTVFSRYDYDDVDKEGKIFVAGFDGIHIPHSYLKIFPPAIYSLGSCFWDYWILLRPIYNNLPLYYPFGKFLWHKIHATQYSLDEWYYLGRYFQWEFRIDKNTPVEWTATQTLERIKQKLIQ